MNHPLEKYPPPHGQAPPHPENENFPTSCSGQDPPPPHPPALKIKIVQLKHKQPIYRESAVNKLQVFWPPLTNFRIYSDLSVLSISM